jgi:hypothetical protein
VTVIALRRLPADHLCPIWRREPAVNGVGSIALDPREARFVLERGWALLDGEKWTTSLDWDGIVEGDGRVSVRITRVVQSDLLEAVA